MAITPAKRTTINVICDPKLLKAFQKKCKDQEDRTGAYVIRKFMESYVSSGKQKELL